MRTELKYHHLTLPRKRFEIATDVKNTAEVFIVEAREGDKVGFGSGTPAKSLADYPKKCAKQLEIASSSLYDSEQYFEDQTWIEIRKESPSAATAIDIAMWDLLSKQEGISLTRLFGGNIQNVETDATIDIKPPAEAHEEAKRLVDEGFKTIKIKVGTRISDDLARVKTIREAVGPRVKLFVDANGGFDKDMALKFWSQTSKYDLEFFEQPVPADKLADSAELRKKHGMKICADESIIDEESLQKVINSEAADVINIKLMKCGGLSSALEMEKMLRNAGLELMIGCMGDVGFSIAAAAHLASSKKAEHVDLDSHLNIEPVCNGPEVKKGSLLITDEPGLGVNLLNGWRRWSTRGI